VSKRRRACQIEIFNLLASDVRFGALEPGIGDKERFAQMGLRIARIEAFRHPRIRNLFLDSKERIEGIVSTNQRLLVTCSSLFFLM
jgi:hypothetical protein